MKVITIILIQLQSLCNTLLIFRTKQPQRYEVTTASKIVTTIKLSLITPNIAVEIKCQRQSQVHTTVYQACASGNKEKASCFLYLLQFENTISIRQTKIEYA